MTSRASFRSRRLDDLSELALAAEEGGRGDRKGRAIETFNGGELAVPELVHALGRLEILEAVLAEVDRAQLNKREPSRRKQAPGRRVLRRRCGRRDGRRGRRSPRRASERRSRVQADAHADRAVRRGASVNAEAAASAPGAVGNAKKKASPCVSTSTPPFAAQASRITRRCSASASA